MTSLVTVLSSAVRQLLRHPAHTAGVTLLLTVALGLASSMFRAFNGYLLRPLPAPSPERLVHLRLTQPGQGFDRPVPVPDFLDWRQRQTSFEGLAAAGLFGMLAHAVSSRITEIGLRRAIGATGRSILSLLLHQNGRPVVIGAGAGLLLGFGLSHLLKDEMVGVTPTDPSTLALTVLTVLGCAALAALAPALRALRVDPARALRME